MGKNKATLTMFLNLIVILCFSQTVYTQGPTQLSQSDFEAQLMAAYSEGKDTVIISVIRDHRLWVKPFVDKLITESIQLGVQGEKEDAKQKFEMAEKIANTFEKTFGEKSLVAAVAYVSSWSSDQKERKLLADSLYAVGTKMRRKKAQRDQALSNYLQALDLFREIGDQRGEGKTLGGLGVIYAYKRDPEQALSYFQEALKTRQQVDDKQLVGNSYNDIGNYYLIFRRDYAEALHYYLKAEKMRAEIDDEVGRGRSLATVAQAYRYLGELDQALSYYAKAFEVNKKVGDERRMASALYNSGIILKDLGRYPDAFDYLERALKIREKLGNKAKIGDVLNVMGNVYKRLGDFESALESYHKVLTVMEEVKNEKGIAIALSNIGVVLRNLGRAEKASEIFQRAMDIFQKLGYQEGVLDALSSLGLVYFDLHDYSKAEEYDLKALQMSQELKVKTEEVRILVNLGNAQNFRGKLDQALANYREALKIARSLNTPELIWPALLGVGDNYERRREYDKAIEHYSQALAAVEQVRGTLQSEQYKASFMGQKRFAYEAVIHLLGMLHEKDNKRGYDRQAFHYAERAKARAFLDLLAEALANVREGADPNLLQRHEELLADLSQVQQQLQLESSKARVADSTVLELKDKINELEKAYRNLQKEINLKNPKYSELQYPQPSTMKAAQSNVLDDKTVLLEYSLGDSSSSLWVITKDSHQLYRLPNRETLQDQVDIIRYALLNPKQSSPEFFANSSYKLYQLLLQPAEALIKKKKKLVIIPDGVLHYLPFEILLTEKKDGKVEESYSKLPYLIKRNPISYGQSASVLRSLREERTKQAKTVQKQLLAFGDPVFGETEELPLEKLRTTPGGFGDTTRGGLSRLKYSGMEIENIAKLFPPEQVAIYLRGDAKEENVKAKGKLAEYKYVHFATHGIINERKPDFSSIVLTQDGDPQEDGFLQAAEIFNLSMNAELVVLSACQTGLGKMVRGEGMIGLTRAFMYAGTPSVLVSLWSVSDISTAKLMAKFYENLIKKKKEKTEALRQAQLFMLNQERFSHPFYWAPFVLIGDWQ